MKSIVAAAITTFVSVISAVPTPFATATVSRSFRLKTQFISGMEGFNDQYLFTFHTGAGENAPCFSKEPSAGIVGFLNGTTYNAVYGDQGYTVTLAFGAPEDLYAGWGPLTLNIAGSPPGISSTDPVDSGFYIGPEGFFTHTVGGDQQFNGWRVCNWVHDIPELFFDTLEPYASDVPTSCARVYLVAEYV